MKTFLYTLLLSLMFAQTRAQVTATNFTAVDCNAVSHTLFNELDNGTVVVLVWIMPCAMCISDGSAAYNAVQSFAVSHPGKVKYYLIDDAGNAGCAALATWASNNAIVPDAIFDNVGVLIDENDYGGGGMPHVVVTAGTNHHIFLNIKDGANNESVITDAINEAINPTGFIETETKRNSLVLTPNPAHNTIRGTYYLDKSGDVELMIIDICGRVVQQQRLKQQASGENKLDIILNTELPNGMYVLQVGELKANRATFTLAR